MSPSRMNRVLAIVLGLAAVVGCGNDPETVAGFDGDCVGLEGPGAAVGIDIETGVVLWERRIGDATGVAIHDGVLAGAGQSGAVLGVDGGSGNVSWCQDYGRVDQVGNIVNPGFAAASGVFATVVAGGDVVAFEPQSGSELWRVPIGLEEGLQVKPGLGSFRVFSTNGADPLNLDPVTGAPISDAREPADDGGLVLRFDQPYLDGRQEVDVAVERDGQEMWSDRLPGFVVTLHQDVVVVIDQTGGTGSTSATPSTLVSGYEAETGALLWQTPLPGTPDLVASAGSMIVIPSGTVLHALDLGSGEIVWESDAGSPGRGIRYSEPGTFSFLEWDNGASNTLVGIVVAEEPYRD